jgi:hypothetical protein
LLAGWNAGRSSVHDGFARGQPEFFGNAVEAGQAIDVMEFLWASLALFDDETTVDITEEGRRLRGFCRSRRKPPTVNPSGAAGRSAWSSTLVAGLELAKQGDVVLGQGEISRLSFLTRSTAACHDRRRGRC